MSEAEKMLLADALTTAIKSEKKAIILKRIICILALVAFALMVLLVTK